MAMVDPTGPAGVTDAGGRDQAELLAAIAGAARHTFLGAEARAASFIREAIVEGIFVPGQRLHLDVIAKILGTSRMPVRACLSELEREGLVRVNAYRGATVTVLTAEQVAELYEMRLLLETYLLGRVVDKLDDQLIDELQAVVGELEVPGELGARVDRRNQFYELLYARAERPRALAQVNTLRASIGSYLLQRVDDQHDHEDFLRFLRAGDADGAIAWLAEHLLRVSRLLQELVTREAPQQG